MVSLIPCLFQHTVNAASLEQQQQQLQQQPQQQQTVSGYSPGAEMTLNNCVVSSVSCSSSVGQGQPSLLMTQNCSIVQPSSGGT